MSPLEKRYVVYLALSTLVVLAVCIPDSPLSVRAATRTAHQAGAEGSQKRSPTVDRTTPIMQKMTPAQRHHSELFQEFSTGARLLDELTNLNHFRDRGVSSDPVAMSDSALELRCAADHVFVGTVEDARSLPVADGTFLFTEYTVVVREGIVPGPIGAIRPGTKVTVVRPGGSIRVGEYTITAFISDVPKLATGASYLFFENRIAATGAYRSAHHEGTFSVSNETVKSAASQPTFEGDLVKGTRKDLFLNAVRAAAPCK